MYCHFYLMTSVVRPMRGSKSLREKKNGKDIQEDRRQISASTCVCMCGERELSHCRIVANCCQKTIKVVRFSLHASFAEFFYSYVSTVIFTAIIVLCYLLLSLSTTFAQFGGLIAVLGRSPLPIRNAYK